MLMYVNEVTMGTECVCVREAAVAQLSLKRAVESRSPSIQTLSCVIFPCIMGHALILTPDHQGALPYPLND